MQYEINPHSLVYSYEALISDTKTAFGASWEEGFYDLTSIPRLNHLIRRCLESADFCYSTK